MNRSIKLGLVGSARLFLSGCTDSMSQIDNESPIQPTNQTTVPAQATQTQLSNDYYRALIVDGKYQPSKNRGVSLSLNSPVNMKDFESGLLEVAKTVFPTDEYIFQEGQYIEEDVASSWLGRKSEENPLGLNPTSNGSTDPESRIPNYLEQILEQDFIIQTEAGYQIGGIAIGLAMNQIDYYSVADENQNFDFYQQEIDPAVLIEQAKTYGNEIVSRLRQDEELADVPIMIGIFLQSPQDDLAGGVFTHQGLSTEGNQVSEWLERDDEKVLFPKAEESADASHFANFKGRIQDFFPNLSGVTGVGHYSKGQLLSLDIDIMTQFYGTTEIIAFTQHVTDAATQYLPQNIQIEIEIKSIDGLEAFLTREQNSQTFNFHIFD